MPKVKRVFQFLAAYVLASLVLGAVLVLQSYPSAPQSVVQWGVLFVLAIPLTLLGEAIGELLFRNSLTRAVDKATERKTFSWLRIGYMLVLALTVVALMWALHQVLPWTAAS